MWSVVKRFSEDLECCDCFVSTCKCSVVLYQILYIELFYVTANDVVGNVLYCVILCISLSF